MERKMCSECPFNPASFYFRRRDEWAAHCEEEMIRDGHPMDGSLAHGCHNLGDVPETTDQSIICIGHVDWLKGIKHENLLPRNEQGSSGEHTQGGVSGQDVVCS